MSQYTRPTTNHSNALDRIGDAYTAAGLDRPNRAADTRAALHAEPTATEVARQAAAGALTATDPTAWLNDALTRIARAQAADTLRREYAQTVEAEARRTAADTRTEAVQAVAAHVAKVIDKLSANAAKLPTGTAALEPNAVITANTAKEYTSVTQALATLGVFAAIHESTQPPTGVRGALNSILPLIHLTKPIVQEQIRATIGEDDRALNPDQLATTLAVRQLNTDAEQDVDLALVNVARGNYHGISLHLLDSAELTALRNEIPKAFTRRRVTPTNTNTQPVSWGATSA